MCTLTFVPQQSGFILTSSRDEIATRSTANIDEHWISGEKLLFSQDQQKGGTWLALGEKKVACLLNGSNEPFKLKNNYSESRGNLLLEIFNYEDAESFFTATSFNLVAPFTIVIIAFENDLKITEISWNGEKKMIRNLDHNSAQIWSSTTLYTSLQRSSREEWFANFIIDEEIINAEQLLQFHEKKHTPNAEYNILMKRKDGKQTTSLSQIIVNQDESIFYHKNFLDQSINSISWTKKEMDLP